MQSIARKVDRRTVSSVEGAILSFVLVGNLAQKEPRQCGASFKVCGVGAALIVVKPANKVLGGAAEAG